MSVLKPLFTKTAFGLVPESDAARELLASTPIGSCVAVEWSRPRNIQFHRLYWALVTTVAEGIGVKPDNVHCLIKLRTGYYTLINTKSGRVQVPKSISFAKMSSAEFKAFFEDACRYVCEEVLQHISSKDLRRQIEQMVGVPESEDA
jgi:hypothetical protein